MNKRLKNFFLSGQEGVFLYTPNRGKSYLFTKPVRVIRCEKIEEVNRHIDIIAEETKKGLWCAGYISYEASQGILKGLNIKKKNKKEGKEDLLYFGVYKKPLVIKNCTVNFQKEYGFLKGKPNESFSSYLKKFRKIKDYIKNGDVYQVNFCLNFPCCFKGDEISFFSALCAVQEVQYAAFIRFGGKKILSISPELFFEIKNGIITMKPMKGTVLKRKKAGFLNAVEKLKNQKGIAENLMITDMIRNDLGKICKNGSVKVPELFSVEEYSTLFQMTSTVTGELKENIGINDVLRAVFPSGSVTGAPKISAMNIIARLEKQKRGVYTGAIGFAAKGRAVFNVPIRTIEINGTKAQMGVGSGIVYDSKAKEEYKECLGKAFFTEKAGQNFGLIESMLLKDGKIFLPIEHLKRMWNSAKFFGMKIDIHKAEHIIKKTAMRRQKGEYKLRLLYKGGDFSVSCKRLKALPEGKAVVSKRIMDSSDIFLRHKTTLRSEYDNDYKEALKNGYADVIYVNEKGELTEAHSSNIFIKSKGKFYTPPVSCGLLPGTLRNHLLKKQPVKFKVKKILYKEIKTKKNIFLCNSVRGIKRLSLLNLKRA